MSRGVAMKEFVWSDSLSLKNRLIDEQHQQVITTLQSLPAQQDDEFDRVFREVLRYTLEHFSVEEGWMRQIDYPQTEEHMDLHIEMSRHFDSYLQQYVDGILDEIEFKDFLLRWLENHIFQEDMKIASFLSQRES